jgi:cell pole-organizing protein PopZ
MEEILASIRRIISEEDKPAEAGGDVLDLQPPPPPMPEMKAPPAAEPVAAPAPPPAPKPEPVAAKAPPPVFDEPEPLAPAREVEEDLMVMEEEEAPAPAAAPQPAPTPKAEIAQPPVSSGPTDTLVSAPVASQAAGALGKLMGSMLVSNGGTLDDLVRELLKPMLKDWLDANLPQLVEAEVAKEIERIRRLAR